MSQTAYIIGVDIGTQGTKSGLFDIAGHCYAENYENSELLSTHPGSVVQDPEAIFGSVLHTVKAVIEQSGVNSSDVYAISIAGQMAGIMGIDKDYNAVTPYDSWLDTRCEKYITHIKATCEDEIIRSTGGPVTYAHGPKILWWKNEHPDVYKQIHRFVTLSAFVAGKLCGLKGEDAWFDYTYLHFTGFSDTVGLKWNKELLKTFDVDESIMGKIVSPYDIVGRISEKWANECGLLPGTIVAAGCGDSAASSLGAGITEPDVIYDVAGTASIFSAATDVYAPDIENKTILYARSVIKDLWIPLAYISGGGLCIRWFRDTFMNKSEKNTYSILDSMAEEVKPGCDNLYFVPHFAGRTCPNDPDIRGAWIGLSWTHNKAHMYRAVLESIGYEYRLYNKIITSKTGKVPSVIYGTGGGAESRVFNQIKADILGIDYIPMKCGDTGIAGSAFVAGMAAGLYKNESEMKVNVNRSVEKGDILSYNKSSGSLYVSFADKYERILQEIQKIYKI